MKSGNRTSASSSGTLSPPVATGIRPGSVSAWILGARLRTLTAAAAPVLVGTACAWQIGSFHFGPAFAALLGSLFIQIGTNFANDYSDFKKGADTNDRIGPVRVTQSALLKPTEVKSGMIACFGAATVCGAYLATIAGWPVIAIGVLSILSGYAYTGGPLPLGYNGLGDLFVFLFFGFVAVCGTVFVQALSVPMIAVAASIPIGSLATNILVVNNVRDCETDRRAGKGTLPARLGRGFGRSQYVALLIVAALTPLWFALAGLRSPWTALPLLAIPLAVPAARAVLTRTDGPTLNDALTRTAKLLFVFGILLSVGIVLA